MKSMIIECTVFFQNNPFAFETLESLATRLGRPESLLDPVLNELTSLSFLEKLGDGKRSIYKFRKAWSYELSK